MRLKGAQRVVFPSGACLWAGIDSGAEQVLWLLPAPPVVDRAETVDKYRFYPPVR